MNRKTTFALALGAAIASAVSAQAATMTMTIQYAGSYGSDFAPKGNELNALPAPGVGLALPTSLPTDIHEFNVFMSITGLAAGEDLETVGFDALLGPGVTPLAPGEGGGWQTSSLGGLDAGYRYDPAPNTTNVCGTTGVGCQQVFANNQDAGVANDLKGILLIANSISDATFTNFAGTHQRHPGETEPGNTDTDNVNLAGPLYIGSIWVHWDGTGTLAVPGFVGLGDPSVANAWTTRNVTGNVQAAYSPATMDQGPSQQFANVPEPATFSLLSLAMVGALGLIRRR